MSSQRGDAVVSWLERSAERFLRDSQPDAYQMLLLHVGATDKLRGYSSATEYWQYVQAILDCFFTAAERAGMCAELVDDPLFRDDADFQLFSHQARAEIRSHQLIMTIQETAGVRAALRSII